MALLYIDGFEHLDIRRYPVVSSVTFGTGRIAGTSSAHFDFSTAILQANFNPLPTSSTYYIGVAVMNLNDSANVVFQLKNSLRTSNCLYVTCPGGAGVFPTVNKGSDNALIATSSIPTYTGTWFHLGVEVTVGASTSGKIYINQVQAASWTGIDTRNGGDLSKAGAITLGRPGGSSTTDSEVDDLYVMDSSGSINNTWSGDLAVRTLFPSAAGSSTQWTVSPSGANYAAVDETGGAGVDYVYSNVVGNTDLYAMQDLPATGVYDVKGVQVTGVMTASDGGAVNAAMLSRGNGVTTEGSSALLALAATGVSSIFQEASPGVPWTKTLVDGMEAGVRVK